MSDSTDRQVALTVFKELSDNKTEIEDKEAVHRVIEAIGLQR